MSRTLSARYYKDGSEILIEQEGKNQRRLTPRECARLRGFQDDDIEQFLDAFGLTPAETNRLIEINWVNHKIHERQAIDSFIETLKVDFPNSVEMSQAA